jgi:hypothetical protein
VNPNVRRGEAVKVRVSARYPGLISAIRRAGHEPIVIESKLDHELGDVPEVYCPTVTGGAPDFSVAVTARPKGAGRR